MPKQRFKLILKYPFPSWMAHHQQNESIYNINISHRPFGAPVGFSPAKLWQLPDSVPQGRARQGSRRIGAGTVSS